MQDESNLKMTPSKQNMSAIEKCMYPNVRWPPNIKDLLSKNILLFIAYI